MSVTPSMPTSGQTLAVLSDNSFTQLVNEAFRNYQSTLALSRSPLANSALVVPTLVLDEVSPSAEDRGRGLRALLQWAVKQIGPGPATYPLGTHRPLDDPTWIDPRWWHYNILRHRYLEPLHPDEFVEGGRHTDTLLALTGITSSDAFFDARNRAIKEVAAHLRQQLLDGQATPELQQMALAENLQRLDHFPEAEKLLGIAATFDTVFSRLLLIEMADDEHVHAPHEQLDRLIADRFLLVGDHSANLWISPQLREHIYLRQVPDLLRRRHCRSAEFYESQVMPLPAVSHWQKAGEFRKAARLVLESADELINEMQLAEMIGVLRQFGEQGLTTIEWREIQILLSDLYARIGQREDALTACRVALKSAQDPESQARIYRRMGKLYEKHNQLHSIGYYKQAAERFDSIAPSASSSAEYPYLLKDRGWLYILRGEYAHAEADLKSALNLVTASHRGLEADVLDALADLFCTQQQYEMAIEYARRALALREGLGNLPRVSASFNSLGNIYADLGDYSNAIAAYREALTNYKKLGNQEAIAGTLLNIGAVYFGKGDLPAAINQYQQSLTLCIEHRLPLAEVTTRYNIAEACQQLLQYDEARYHSQLGLATSIEAGFTDEIAAFERLLAELGQERQSSTSTPASMGEEAQTDSSLLVPDLSADDQAILNMMTSVGQLTARTLMERLDVSRATATRRLSALAEKGYIIKKGQGRATYYVDALQSNLFVSPVKEQTRDNEIIQQKVRHHLNECHSWLAQNYRVTEATVAEAKQPSVVVEVRFEELPELSEFFALENQLEDALGLAVDLKPRGIGDG